MERELKAGTSIVGVHVEPLRVIQDDRGAVLPMLREDSALYTRFGEVYFSEVNPGVTKAWKRHRSMTQRFAVPVGRVKFVLYDDRRDSTSRGCVLERVLGRPEAYQLMVVPPGVWYGFQGQGETPSLVANCADMPHDPAEAEQVESCPGLSGYVW